MYASAVNPKHKITEGQWLVSILTRRREWTSPTSFLYGWTRYVNHRLNPYGHSVLILEGLSNESGKIFKCWDIQAGQIINGSGKSESVITEIRAFPSYPHDPSQDPSYSAPVNPDGANQMMISIQGDIERTERALEGREGYTYLPYQTLGERSLLSTSGEINCAQWCEDKLVIALGDEANNYTRGIKTKPKFVSGVRTGNEQADSITASFKKCCNLI